MSYADYIVPRDERLDRIARTIYQTERDGTVEALLDANPGLAAIASLVPRGTILKVPAKPAPKASTLTRPWE